jgi:hypothetical protein
MLAGLLTALGPAAAAPAAACQPPAGQPPSPGMKGNHFASVTMLSACNAWAVGSQTSSSNVTSTLIEHWNGTAWTTVPSPNPGNLDNQLRGVRALSATDIWAVGTSTSSGTGIGTLTLHWNGTAWKSVHSLSPGGIAEFNAVRTVSHKDVWAVGFFTTGHGDQTLIEHWNGSSWRIVPSPSPAKPGRDSELTGIAATSKTNAWAVGDFFRNGDDQSTLILHWNGKKWTRMTSPSPGTSDQLGGIGASSARNAWAVGFEQQGTVLRSLILRWNGKTWKPSPTPAPAPGTATTLGGIAATSASSAIAVGATSNGVTSQALVLTWTGAKWLPLQTQTPGTSGSLAAVAASSPGNAWMVGTFQSLDFPTQALALHCC